MACRRGVAADDQPRTAEATGKGRPRARHDQTHKEYYELVGTLRDLQCGYLPENMEGAEKWFECFDFECAQLVSTENITMDLGSGYIEMLWQATIVNGERAGNYLYVVVMLGYVGLRVQSAATRNYERRRKDPRSRRTPWLVTVLTIMVYNDRKLWQDPTHMRDLARPGTIPDAGERRWEPGFTVDRYRVIDMESYAGRELPEGNIVSQMIRTESMGGWTSRWSRWRRRSWWGCGSSSCRGSTWCWNCRDWTRGTNPLAGRER